MWVKGGHDAGERDCRKRKTMSVRGLLSVFKSRAFAYSNGENDACGVKLAEHKVI